MTASRSRLAAEYKHATGCEYVTAARHFGITAGPVAREYKSLYRGYVRDRSREYAMRKPAPPKLPPSRTVDYDRIRSALAFMARYGTSIEDASRVCDVPVEELKQWAADAADRRAA
jgi:hypothetical protein